MTIYQKSSHPVEVKKISVRIWSLRDEIEAAIERRIKECEAAGIPLYIDDIKKFYNMSLDTKLTDESNVLQMPAKEDGVTALMESLVEESPSEPSPAEETPSEVKPEGEQGESNTFKEAEGILAEQATQGVENHQPNPMLQRPYQRQAPDINKVSYGFSFLADINMETILSFTKDKFLQGQSVVVEFLIPQSFMMTAEVTYCHHYARTSKIISTTKPDYRVQCKFSYSISGERDNLRNFLKSIQPEVPDKKKKKESEEDSLGL